MPTANLEFEIFDKFGNFVMPTAEQIATLDADAQERFAHVQKASAEFDTAKGTREAAEQSVKDALQARDDAEAELRRVRPNVDPTANAKEFIASERAQR